MRTVLLLLALLLAAAPAWADGSVKAPRRRPDGRLKVVVTSGQCNYPTDDQSFRPWIRAATTPRGAEVTAYLVKACDAQLEFEGKVSGTRVTLRVKDVNRSNQRTACATPSCRGLLLEGLLPGRYRVSFPEEGVDPLEVTVAPPSETPPAQP